TRGLLIKNLCVAVALWDKADPPLRDRGPALADPAAPKRPAPAVDALARALKAYFADHAHRLLTRLPRTDRSIPKGSSRRCLTRLLLDEHSDRYLSAVRSNGSTPLGQADGI